MGKIITFYSYKGGVGRTMALANVAVLLARWGYKVLIIDWDLEAPGLELYFTKYVNVGKVYQKEGIVDLLYDLSNEVLEATEPAKWRNLLVEITLPNSLEKLHFLTAGKRTRDYFNKVRNLDLPFLYTEKKAGIFIEELRKDWKQTYDYILVDSRAGVTDIEGVCTVQLPDTLVMFFTANNQSLNGIIEVHKEVKEARQEIPFNRFSLISLPVPNRFDLSEEFDEAQDWLDMFSKKLPALYANWLPASIKRRDFLERTKIPYIPYFSFGEKLAVLERGSTDPTGLGYAYETLAALIANQLESVEQFMENRDEYIRITSSKTAITSKPSISPTSFVPGYKYDIFVSYALVDDEPLSGADEGWVTTLVKGLKTILDQKLGHKDAFSFWMESQLSENPLFTQGKLSRLRQLIDGKQQEWELFNAKLNSLRETLIEIAEEKQFRLKSEIDKTTKARQRVEQELNDLESQLIPQSPKRDFTKIIQALQSSAMLLIILSKGYIVSEWYQKESSFLNMVQEHIREGLPVFLIERDRLEAKDRLPEFAYSRSYRFWAADQEGKPPRVLGMPQPQPDDLRYYDQLDMLSDDIGKELRRLRSKEMPVSDDRPTVFLADVTEDLYSQREDVKRSLEQFKLEVLPKTNYSLEVSAFQDAVRDDLGKSDLFVQLLSAVPGKRPPELPQGYVRCQYELAEEMKKPILQWRAPELNIDGIQDAEYQNFLQLPTVRGDIGIEGLKDEIVKKLQEQKQPSSPSHLEQGKLVFIMADDSDSLLSDKICQLLDEEEQIEYVQFAPSNHQETSIREAFEAWTIDCDAVMLMYGQVDVGWLNQVFRNARKIVWKREKDPIPVYVVCDPPPEQKQLLKLKIRGMKQLEYGSWSDKQKLHEFIKSLREEGSV